MNMRRSVRGRAAPLSVSLLAALAMASTTLVASGASLLRANLPPATTAGSTWSLTAFAGTATARPAGDAAFDTSRVAGSWQGELALPGGISLRMVIHIAADETGRLTATIDSPDQGARGIPVASATFEGERLVLEVAAVAGRLEAALTPEDRLVGEWHQGGSTFPLTLERSTGEPARSRPQEPLPPFPYRSEDVRYPNPEAAIHLAGTLTIPDGPGPFPAVALITGSGAQNRDSEVFGHRIFLVLADHLTRHGIAVLRSDDRGVRDSEGDFAAATSRDFARDAAAAAAYLRTRPEVDQAAVGLIGMSEGGLIAPIVATEHPDLVNFIVLLAGPGVTGKEIVLRQSELIARASGVPEEQIAANVALQTRLFRLAMEEADASVARTRLEQALRETVAAMSPDDREAQGLTPDTEEAWIQSQLRALTSPWFRYFLTHDPAPVLRNVRVPVLALFGELDLQVQPSQNMPDLQQALRDGGNPDFTVRELPGLNHLFQTASTGSPMEYARIEETMSPLALDAVTRWILERFGGR